MIPNYESYVTDTKNKYPRAWSKCHHDGDPEAWDFIILTAQAINKVDPLIGLNGKRGDPNNWSWDALNWRGDSDDPPNVIDCVAGAGGSNPSPTWQVTNTTGAFVSPVGVKTVYDYGTGGGGGGTPTPTPTPKLPSYEQLGGDASGTKVGNYLFHDYGRAGSTGDPGMGVWFNRVMYDAISGICKTYDEAIAKHRAGWCQGLGVPVDDFKG